VSAEQAPTQIDPSEIGCTTPAAQVVRFEPLVAGHVGIYTCGPTVYGPQHLGNMRSQLLDLLRRVLAAAGYQVRFVTNITDVGHLTDDADDSPWGVGFPGWHIECSAMSIKHLGERFDIHTGGIDHVRVHHTNEVAQTESALGIHPWVTVWMHNEFLDIGGEKISKSKGHVLLVDTLVEQGISPLAFRYFFLQAHYRQQQAFTFDLVRAADTALRRLVHHAVVARDASTEGGPEAEVDPSRTDGLRRAFWEALADDLRSRAGGHGGVGRCSRRPRLTQREAAGREGLRRGRPAARRDRSRWFRDRGHARRPHPGRRSRLSSALADLTSDVRCYR
jgi:cysteinyl-tRNA synthetase